MERIRVLFLGGAYHQIPIIREAKKRGYYIITCDYSPQNKGHQLADEYYNISTTDFNGVLTLAEKIKPHFIIAYATDPAAPVAAYVSERMGLPGNTFESVSVLSNKCLFREFQKKHNFNTPLTGFILQGDNVNEKLRHLKFPIIIKPSDSSGSKGISLVESYEKLETAVNLAMKFSRNKRIIAEEFIECVGSQLHGDGFVLDGELKFICLGDHQFKSKTNSLVPVSTTWPSHKSNKLIKLVTNEVDRLLKKAGFLNGPVNIEIRITSEDKIYILEIGPRSGGNFVPQAVKYASGFDMIKATLDVLENNDVDVPSQSIKFTAYYVIHSDKEGTLKKLSISEELNPFIMEFHQKIFKGEKILSYNNSTAAIGVIILQFAERDSMDFYLSHMENFINLEIYNSA